VVGARGALTVWFVVDTTVSLTSGYWQDAALNTLFWLAFLPGLAGTRPFSLSRGGRFRTSGYDPTTGR